MPAGVHKQVARDFRLGIPKGQIAFHSALGGEVRFGSKLSGLVLDESGAVSGARVVSGGVEYVQECSSLVLATGHSARDTFEMLLGTGVPMEATVSPLELVGLIQAGAVPMDEDEDVTWQPQSAGEHEARG